MLSTSLLQDCSHKACAGSNYPEHKTFFMDQGVPGRVGVEAPHTAPLSAEGALGNPIPPACITLGSREATVQRGCERNLIVMFYWYSLRTQ